MQRQAVKISFEDCRPVVGRVPNARAEETHAGADIDVVAIRHDCGSTAAETTVVVVFRDELAIPVRGDAAERLRHPGRVNRPVRRHADATHVDRHRLMPLLCGEGVRKPRVDNFARQGVPRLRVGGPYSNGDIEGKECQNASARKEDSATIEHKTPLVDRRASSFSRVRTRRQIIYCDTRTNSPSY